MYGDNAQGKMNNPFEKQTDGSFKYQLGEWLSTTNAKVEEQMVIKTFFESYAQKQAMKGTASTGYNADDEFQDKSQQKVKKSKKSKKRKEETKLSQADYKLNDKRPKYEHFSKHNNQMVDSNDISSIPLPNGAAPSRNYNKPFAETSPFLENAAPKVYNPDPTSRSGKLDNLGVKLSETMEGIKRRQQNQKKYSSNPRSIIQENEDNPFEKFG